MAATAMGSSASRCSSDGVDSERVERGVDVEEMTASLGPMASQSYFEARLRS